MVWDWVAPTATGLVGLAGIAATWNSGKRARETQFELARSQHASALDQTLLTERRLIYARYLGALMELRLAASIAGVPLGARDRVRAAAVEALRETPGGADFLNEETTPLVEALADSQTDAATAILGLFIPERAIGDLYGEVARSHAEVVLIGSPQVGSAATETWAAVQNAVRSFALHPTDGFHTEELAKANGVLAAAMRQELAEARAHQ
jgi:hypothetical protein